MTAKRITRNFNIVSKNKTEVSIKYYFCLKYFSLQLPENIF